MYYREDITMNTYDYASDYASDYFDFSSLLQFTPVDELDDLATLRRLDAVYETCREVYSAYNAEGIRYGRKPA